MSMETVGTITVLGEPEAKGSVSAFPVHQQAAHIVGKKFNIVHRATEWERTVHLEALRQWGRSAQPKIVNRPVGLRVTFHMPRGKTVKREHPHVRPDLDKLLRAVLDGLTGVVFADDAQVCQVVTVKRYAEDQPCVVIVVSAA